MRIVGRGAALTVLLWMLAGCGGQAGEPDASPQPSPEASAAQMAPDDLVTTLTADAAERAGVDPAEVEVRSSERVTWPDGGLGCPEPGQSYTQALVDGYRVILVAGETTYDYRAPDSGAFVLCEQPDLGQAQPQEFPEDPTPTQVP